MKDIKCFLLDMDGTIYLGDKLIDGSKEFLKSIRDAGKRYVFLTNNSSKDKSAYVEKLRRLGIEADQDDIFTSGDAAFYYINRIKKGARLFLLGTPELEEAAINAGFSIEKGHGGEVDFVLLGFDKTLNYDKIWAACEYIEKGVPFIATHPDLNCPLEGNARQPDTGSMIEMFAAATGIRPTVMGKPYKTMAEVIVEKINVKLDQTAMVGDRLYTDVAMGAAAGIKSVLVLSGETSLEDYENQDKYKADYVFDSVRDMIERI